MSQTNVSFNRALSPESAEAVHRATHSLAQTVNEAVGGLLLIASPDLYNTEVVAAVGTVNQEDAATRLTLQNTLQMSSHNKEVQLNVVPSFLSPSLGLHRNGHVGHDADLILSGDRRSKPFPRKLQKDLGKLTVIDGLLNPPAVTLSPVIVDPKIMDEAPAGTAPLSDWLRGFGIKFASQVPTIDLMQVRAELG